MGNFKDNPVNPFEVKVPNKIRKRIAMHVDGVLYEIPVIKSTVAKTSSKITASLKAISAKPKKKRGSMWSRFTDRIKKFLKG